MKWLTEYRYQRSKGHTRREAARRASHYQPPPSTGELTRCRPRILIAPPGTRIADGGWREPTIGMLLTWDGNNTTPPYAVQRDGVLLSTGLPAPGMPPWEPFPADWGKDIL